MDLWKFNIRLKDYYSRLIHLIKISLFENKCKLCDVPLVFEEEKHICNDCSKSIVFNNFNICNRCGKRISRNLQLCGECMINPPSFVRHISFSTYEDKLRDLILKSKYREVKPLRDISINCYIEVFSHFNDINFDYIIPVPMDQGRARNYNHILEIAKVLAVRLRISLEADNLIKIKQTEPQAGLTMAKRLKNLNKAFKLKAPNRLKNKTIIIIDDVYTTGTTIKKCSEPLIRAGATVYAITLARSV